MQVAGRWVCRFCGIQLSAANAAAKVVAESGSTVCRELRVLGGAYVQVDLAASVGLRGVRRPLEYETSRDDAGDR